MAEHKILLPSMGEGVMEATVTGWLKQVGDMIEEDESIVEIATDKVDSDVPSTASGIVKEILVQDGEVVKVGEPMAIIETEDSEASEDSIVENNDSTILDSTLQNNETVETDETIENLNNAEEHNELEEEEIAATAQEIEKSIKSEYSNHTKIISSITDDEFYSPLVRSMAQCENISQEELKQIEGTGLNNRVTKDDIQNYLDNRKEDNNPNPEQAKTNNKLEDNSSVSATRKTETAETFVNAGSNDEIIKMDRMRKLIAQHMLVSKQTSPHVSSFVETDMTNVVLWRNKVKQDFQNREGEKITFMPIIVQAIIKAIKDFPMINISVDGDYIIKKNNINIGIATARPDGNLIVPVIKNADQLSLVGLTKKINDLAFRAKNNQLKPNEVKDGTYTVSNIGSFGNILGTPIINQPEVAIMAIGSIEKKPAVIESPQGDMIAIRHKMYLSHSYDHRVVDGALGGMFVKRVSDYLESFDMNQEI